MSVRELFAPVAPLEVAAVRTRRRPRHLRRDLSPPHLPIAFSHHNVPAEIDQNIALCVFRVAQEALGNAVKHSDAGHIWVD